MRSICFLLGFCILCLQLVGLDRELFYVKLREPTPEWMLEQIEEDLAPFKKELSRKFLNELFKREDLYLVRVRAAKGVVSIEKSKPAQGHPTPDQIITALYKLNQLIALPDIDFVFTSHDGMVSVSPNYVLGTQLRDSDFKNFDEDETAGPVFCITQSNHKNGAILIPDMFALKGFEPGKALVLEGNQIYPWESKSNVIFYRGSDNGMIDFNIWAAHPRAKLVALSTQYPDLINAKFTNLYSPWHMQFALDHGYMGSYVSMKDHAKYKYLISVDASCAATPRFPLLLHSNSVVFKDLTESHLWFFKSVNP